MIIDNIFNSFIWKTELVYEKKYELINNIEKNYYKNPNQTPRNWKCSLHTSFGCDSEILQDIKSALEKKVKEFLHLYQEKSNLRGNFIINNLWYNVYGKNQFQEIHRHGESLFSGCYYLKFNKKIHCQTTFYNPNYNLHYDKINIQNNSYFNFTPDCNEDDLIIFPSYLMHKTDGIFDKTSNEKRITISFNIINCDFYHPKENKFSINYI